MKVSKWGNSLAIRLPAVVVNELNLHEGDEISIDVSAKRSTDAPRTLTVSRNRTREDALARIASMRVTLPPDWKMDRDDLNSRTGD